MRVARILPVLLAFACEKTPSFDWPPQPGHAYPDLELVDQTGRPVRLSSFKGRVILVEPVGMT